MEYMALELPEGAVSGRLTAELLGGDVRTADSVREGEVMVFRFREAELNWRQELAYQRDLLEGGPGECALYADSLGPERGPDF